jgi:hypothetical protein
MSGILEKLARVLRNLDGLRAAHVDIRGREISLTFSGVVDLGLDLPILSRHDIEEGHVLLRIGTSEVLLEDFHLRPANSVKRGAYRVAGGDARVLILVMEKLREKGLIEAVAWAADDPGKLPARLRLPGLPWP